MWLYKDKDDDHTFSARNCFSAFTALCFVASFVLVCKNRHPEKGDGFLVRPTGFEPTTSRVGVWHSIQLSYGRIFFLLKLYKGQII